MSGEWLVTAEGDEVGRFDIHEDARNFASAWNTAYPSDAYPYPPEFVVEDDDTCEDPGCGVCVDDGPGTSAAIRTEPES